MRNIVVKTWHIGLLGNVQNLEKLASKGLMAMCYLSAMVFILGCLSQFLLSTHIPSQNYKNTGAAHVYGPVQINIINKKTYHFDQLYMNQGGAFGYMEIDRIYEFSKSEVEELLFHTIPKRLQERFILILPMALALAEKYQVDPFWVLSVMWVESHFNQFAKSAVNAKGLMQVLPGTGIHISKRLGRVVSKKNIHKFIHIPEVNIELGTAYLKYLIKTFEGNYIYATAAYNMGPTRVRKRINKNLPVGVRNVYLSKVKRAYLNLSKPFRMILNNTKRPYENSYVISMKYEQFSNSQKWISSFWHEILAPKLAGL